MSDDASTWNRLAGRYDRIVRLFDTSYPRVRARLADDLPPGRVLELAAGTGQFTLDLARRADALIATDVSPEMVAALTDAVAGAANIETRITSAYAIDAPAAHFDAVFCANALHVMDDPDRALAEIHRVLRPAGALLAPTFLHGADPARRALSRALSLISPFVARSRFTLAGLTDRITAAGFTITHAERMPGLFPLGYVAARRAG